MSIVVSLNDTRGLISKEEVLIRTGEVKHETMYRTLCKGDEPLRESCQRQKDIIE
jgi:hypothetical protein